MQRIVLFLIATMTMVTMNSQTFESLNSPWPLPQQLAHPPQAGTGVDLRCRSRLVSGMG